MAFKEQISYQLFPASGAIGAEYVISSFYYTNTEYIKVSVYEADGTVNVKEIDVDYEVVGRTVTQLTTWETGEVLIFRENEYKQETTYRNAEMGFDREALETTLDYITMLAQQNQDLYVKSIRTPLFDEATSLELPTVANRLGKFITFDASGNIIVRDLNSADLGAVLIEWDSDFGSYTNGWLVSYLGELWMGASPVAGSAPGSVASEWTLFSVSIEALNAWDSRVSYIPASVAYYSDKWWAAVTPVLNSAPGIVAGQWEPFKTKDWDADAVYAQNEIINSGGTYFIVTDVGGSDRGVAPVIGGGKFTVWSAETYEAVVTLTATITDGRPAHTVFFDTDTAGALATATLEDGYFPNDKITIVAQGEYSVDIVGTGLLEESVPYGESRSYLWTGSLWVLSAGGSSGGAGTEVGEVTWWPGNGTLPVTKLECDGTLYAPADYPTLFSKLGTTWGGDGTTTFAVPDLQGIHPGAIGTQDVNGRTKGDAGNAVGDYKEDQFQGFLVEVGGSSSTSDGTIGVDRPNNAAITRYSVGTRLVDDGINGDPRTGEYTDVSQAMGRWIIQAQEPAPSTINAVVVSVGIGEVRWWGSTIIEEYDLKCDGQSLSTASYPDLFAKIGYTFGGSGASFNVPDFQGIHPGAIGTQEINGRTKGDIGNAVGDVIEDQFQGHWHNIDVYGSYGNGTNSPTSLNLAPNSTIDDRVTDPVTDTINGTPRTGEYTDVSQVMGNWIIRAKQPATYSLPIVDVINRVEELDTTAGDVDISSYLTAGRKGQIISFYNIGTGGNYITGLPDSIELGDGKGLTLTRGDSLWRYEDVIIEEFTGTGTKGETQFITKWSGGKMKLTTEPISDSGGMALVFLKVFIATPTPIGMAMRTTSALAYFTAISTTGMSLSDGTGTAHTYGGTVEGRWRT